MERVKDKTQGWSKKFLSPGGKEILLKAVATSLPVYCMNLFKLPKLFCQYLDRIMSEYWWSKGDGQKDMHWLAWKRMCVPKKEGGLGFKDFESFNLALLGKQVWRIFQNPDCLMAKVLKGRYFHDTNIFNARDQKKSSYIWKSILHARDAIKPGFRYLIGDGNFVNCWLDPWLTEPAPRPPRKAATTVPDILVSDLINGQTMQWNEERVRTYVHPDDVDQILSLKLGSAPSLDMLGWNYAKNGLYTVKSAYWMITHQPSYEQAPPPTGNIELKRSIWRLNTASKLKHFIWKAVSDILPIGSALQHRHIITQQHCVRCCHNVEDINHVLFNCPYAQLVWRASGIPDPNLYNTQISFEDKLQAIMMYNTTSRLPNHQHFPLWILWRLWKSCNILLFQRRHISWNRTVTLAKQDALEWGNITNRSRVSTPMATGAVDHDQVFWRPPDRNFVKCNYDVSWSASRVGVGWLVRNSNGIFQTGGYSSLTHISSSLQAELAALMVAMKFCYAQGYRNVIFEGDCKEVTDLVQGTAMNFHVHNWIKDVHNWVRKFDTVKFTWIKRLGNASADALAKAAPTSVNFSKTFYQTPVFLTSLVHQDSNY